MANPGDGIFGLVDPELVAQQEAKAQQKAAWDRNFQAAQLAPAQQINMDIRNSAGALGNSLAAPGPDSPAVARAKVLKGALEQTSGMKTPEEKLTAMYHILSNAGLTDDANAALTTLQKLQKNTAEVGKLKAEGDPKAHMRDKLLAAGYRAQDIENALSSFNPETGMFNTADLPTLKHSDQEWKSELVKGADGKPILVRTVVSGPDKGKQEAIDTAGRTSINVNNSNHVQTDKAESAFEQVRKAAFQELSPFQERYLKVQKAQAAHAEYKMNPNPETWAASQAAYRDSVVGEKSTVDERGKVDKAGSLTGRVSNSLSEFFGGVPDERKSKAIDASLAAAASSLEKTIRTKRQQIEAGFGGTGLGGVVTQGAAVGGVGSERPSANIPAPARNREADPKAPKYNSPAGYVDQQNAQRGTNADIRRRATDKPAAPAGLVVVGKDAQGNPIYGRK